ncbi:MAG TPA: YggT family protein [Gemmatimonadales bacterium]|jgi:YggT family protein|nr:YggT family protein [Gemmatimonadales bacterium]
MHFASAVARYVVFGAFVASLLVAFASWLVRTRRVSSFGALGRTLRASSDPVMRPIERRLVRAGGNPVHAGWWLVVGVAAVGVLLLSLLDWLLRTGADLAGALAGGPRAVLAFVIVAAYRVLFLALVVRVIASWFGFFRYARWLRPAYVLTDWLVEPIRRVLPPLGAIDWSPFVALLALWALEWLLLLVVGSV